MNKPTVPEVLPIVRHYCGLPGNGCGGNLHIVLDDKNVRDSDVQFCLVQCEEKEDLEGAELCSLLLRMSTTQRLKICNNLY